jgi:uncharacterized protein YeaO (DUF488 family)
MTLGGSAMAVEIKRAYDKPAAGDGVRILVDHLWPRGMKKEDLRIDRWMREISPSNDLRKWFGHDPDKWPQFRARYVRELQARTAELQELVTLARKNTVTLVFAAKDAEHCNAEVLRELIRKRLSPKGKATS